MRGGAPVAASLRGQTADVWTEYRRRWRFFVPLYLGFAVTFAAAYGAAAWSPTLLIRVYGISPAQVGSMLGPLTMAFAAVGPLAGGLLVDRLTRRGGSTGVMRLLVLLPLGAIPSGLAVLACSSASATLLVASSSAVFAFIGLCLLTTLQAELPPRMRGVGVAVTSLLSTLIGAISGPFLISLATETAVSQSATGGLLDRDSRSAGTVDRDGVVYIGRGRFAARGARRSRRQSVTDSPRRKRR